MKNIRLAILPGILISTLLLILLSRISTPSVVEAASITEDRPEEAAPQPAVEDHVGQCLLPAGVMDSVRQWCDLIQQAAAKYGVDPLLLAAVMTQESGGQPEVLSASGAVGLMQVMPSDGIAASFQCANGPCFASRPTTGELLDPQFNIEYGTRMIAGLIQRHGDVREALAAYGPYNVGYYYADKVLAILAGF